MVGTSEALVKELFIEIAKHALGSGNTPEDIKRRGKYWKYATSILSVVKTTSTVLDKAGVPIAGLVAGAAEHIGDVAKDAGEGLEAVDEANTLKGARESLKKDLAEAAKGSLPIVMVIDDVDRLEDEEIRTLFKMVRVCADFPNVHYLLLFDKRQVARALAPKGGEEDGAEFIEKIVNVAFDLPADTADMRKALLREELAPILALARDDSAKTRVDEIVDKVLCKALDTLRAVKRYAAAAESLGLGMVDASGANYDPADFLALEFLRSEHPVVYEVMLSYEFNPVEAILKKYDPDAPVGSPWLLRLSAVIEATRDKKIVWDVVKELRPELDFTTGEQKGVSRYFGDKANRFFDPAWQPVYVGFDKSRAVFGEEAWGLFAAELEGQQDSVRLPRAFTRDPYPGLVGRTIMFRLQTLSDQALARLLTALLRWGERRLETERFRRRKKAERSASAVWLAEAVLDECWMRGGNAMALLDDLSEQSRASVMRVVLLDGVRRYIERHRKDYWTEAESVESRFQQVVSRVESLQASKRIWEEKGAPELLSLWSSSVSDEISTAWWSEMYDDPILLSSYLEHDAPMPEGERSVTSGPRLSTAAQKIASASTKTLGPRGRQIQAAYQRLISEYEKREIRTNRMR